MHSSITTMTRLPEGWQAANTLSGETALPEDAQQRTNESAAIRTNERDGGRGESGDQSPVAHDASQGDGHRSAGTGRQAAGSSVAVLTSRFGATDREQSGLTCARRRRSRRPDAVVGVIHSASGVGTEWLAVRATADSVADEKPTLRVAYETSVAVEVQTSRRGVNEFTH